jgi:hypothetical protein
VVERSVAEMNGGGRVMYTRYCVLPPEERRVSFVSLGTFEKFVAMAQKP